MWLDGQEKWLEENESLDTHAEWKTLLDSYSSLQVSVSSALPPSLSLPPPSLPPPCLLCPHMLSVSIICCADIAQLLHTCSTSKGVANLLSLGRDLILTWDNVCYCSSRLALIFSGCG